MRPMKWAGLVVLTASATAFAADPKDPVQKVAEAYLQAISGNGDDAGRELLLGGATMNAQLFLLENWKIVSREKVRKEQADLATARKLMADLDKAGREALTRVLSSSNDPDGLGMTELTQDDAAKLMAPTRERARKLSQAHPVMSYVARVGKEVYWHPQNPLRPVLERAGNAGHYVLELHLFQVETREGPRQQPRVWPLRVVRLKTDQVDTGYKILPASDWNGE